MRMEVREVGAAASAAEASVSSEVDLKAAERLHEVLEERQRWISKREEALERKEKLQKLLQLQEPTDSNIEQVEHQKAKEKAELVKQEEAKASKAATAVLERKKELKELQARAEAAREKHQAAAIVLARSLKQLQAKRKREEKEADEHPRKKVDVGSKDEVKAAVATPEMHSCEEFGWFPFVLGSVNWIRSLTDSLETLEQEFKTYTGKILEEVVDWSLLEHSLASLVVGNTAQTVPPSNAARRSVCWQPGRQFLKTPTFISLDADRIQTLIELEKDVVVSVCDSLRMSDSSDRKRTTFIRRRRQRLFLASLLPDGAETSSLSDVLPACVGVNSVKTASSNNLRISFRSHGQMAGVLDRMEKWLREQAEMSEPHSSLSPRFDGQDGSRGVREHFFSSRYAKPFSVANDSVVRQLRGGAVKPASSKRIDPMKVLCHYELNGVCNDKNCSNYHPKDYQPVASERNNGIDCSTEDVDDIGFSVVKMDEMDQLLVSFAEFRARIMPKWPVIMTTQASSRTGKKSSDGKSIATDAPSNGADSAVPAAQDTEKESAENDGDFIALDSREEIPDTGEARYFDDINSRRVYGEMLQAKVEENPSTTDAWLLLAIYQLDLEIGLGDEGVNLSDDDHLQQQLLFLCKELNLKQRSGTSRTLAVEEANLKRCLHTISRALEVEANAYCEALWLLYLHLCRQATNRQTEIDMVEQGVQFLPNSHALWLRYISTYDFDSVGMAEGIYWRLLEHLARTNSAEDGSKTSTATKEVSILLTAICFHLCIKLWHAGATSRILELLSALLQLDKESSEFAWCGMSKDWHILPSPYGIAAVKSTKAFSLGSGGQGNSKKDESLSAFFREHVDKIQQYPGASLTAAELMGLSSTGEQRAHQLMLTMMNRSSEIQFPEALHHYLSACRQFPALVDALDKTFPEVMKHLANLLDVDIGKVEKSIQDIMHDTSNISKSRALKDLLETLLGAWMDQLASLRRGSAQHQHTVKQMRSLADIYVALDICHLMGLLLEPSVAINGIQMVLSSSSFGILSLEARQLAWMQRFVFQVDFLQQEDMDSILWREHQAMLTQLFRKHMAEMSVEAEMMRQVSKRIKCDIANSAIEDAVRDCLNPERSQLITYDVNLELFRLCSAAVAGPEKAAFYASCTDVLALSSEFSLSFSDTATHEWELLAARASLRRCLGGAKTQHPQILQALVAVELRLRNMKAVSSLLETEMQANPLLLESWRLAMGLEILLGDKVDHRSKMIAEEMERRQLVLACNTFGDDKISDQKSIPWCRYQETTSLSLRGLGLECVPNAVLLQTHLRASDVATLTKLEILQAEENDISANELSKISDLLSRREVALSDVVAQTTEAKSSSQQEEKLEDIAMKQPAHTNCLKYQVEVTNEAEGTRWPGLDRRKRRRDYSSRSLPRSDQQQGDRGSSDMTKPVDALPISTGDDLSTEGIAEAEDFAQNHSEVVTASAVRRQSSHDVAAIARGKLTAYMDQNQIDNRAEVRRRNPTLWREFLAASLPVNLELPACRLCFAPNDGPTSGLTPPYYVCAAWKTLFSC
ncbi:putative zinc-finger domain [Phytophthora cactorum]|nr:putative zinc-finger domain [Phytophthora cactorum]